MGRLRGGWTGVRVDGKAMARQGRCLQRNEDNATRRRQSGKIGNGPVHVYELQRMLDGKTDSVGLNESTENHVALSKNL